MLQKNAPLASLLAPFSYRKKLSASKNKGCLFSVKIWCGKCLMYYSSILWMTAFKANREFTFNSCLWNIFIPSSRSILRYLANKYDKDHQLYPVDVENRAKVDMFLDYDLGSVSPTMIDWVVRNNYSNFIMLYWCSYMR